MVKTNWLNKTLTENVGKVIQTLTEASWINSNQSIVPIYVYTCKDTDYRRINQLKDIFSSSKLFKNHSQQ